MADQYAGPERREMDPVQQKIEDLIAAEEDPKDRAFLMILNKMAKNLEVNTELTQTLSAELKAHTREFAKHEQKEMAAWNQGRGMWRMMVYALAILQAVFVYVISEHVEMAKLTRKDLDTLAKEFVAHRATVEAHIKVPEKK